MLRDNWAFFEVFGSSDLWREFKKHMFPNCEKSNFYDYRDGDAAVTHGYLSLVRESTNLTFTEIAMYDAIETDNFEMVKFLHEERNQPLISYHIRYVSECKNTNILEYILENVTIKHPDDISGCLSRTIERGNVEMFLYLLNIRPSLYDLQLVIREIITYNRLDLLTALHNKGIRFLPSLMDELSKYGKLEMVKYLHTVGYSCTSYAMEHAAKNGDLEMVKFLHNNTQVSSKLVIDNAIWKGNTEVIDFLHLNSSEKCSLHAFNRAVVWDCLELVKTFCLFSKVSNISKALTLAKLHNRRDIAVYLEELLASKP